MPAGWKLTADQKASLVDDYVGGLPMSEVAEKYGCTIGNVRGLLRRRGVKARRPGGTPKVFTPGQVAAMVADYRAGMSQEAIARKHGIGQVTAGRLLRQTGIPMRQSNRSGERNGNWRGGRVQMGGYVYVALPEDDPMRAMANRQGYVGEHRLVMARHLGRPLLRTETVHHIDDRDRSDNRIENLQLRQGQHGNGAAFRCLDCGSANVEAVPLGENALT